MNDDASALRFRSAAADDLETVLDLYRHLHPEDPRPANASAAWSDLITARGVTVLVGALPSGALVTSCTVVVIPNMTRNAAPYALIENVVTHADHRCRGYGQAALRAGIRLANAAGCYKIMLMTGSKREATLRFYENAGFKRDKTAFTIRRDV